MTEQERLDVPAGSAAAALEHAYRRLAHIYEISQLFARFENVDETFDHALAVAAKTLRLRSAILIEEEEGRIKMICWPSESQATEEMKAAKAHAQESYSYLIGRTSKEPLDWHEQAGLTALPSRAKSEPQLASGKRFIVIPLVVRDRPTFGALQVEGAEPLDKSDLFFVNSLSNQLAVALDRDFAWRRDIRRRQEAEELKQRYETLVNNLDHAFVWEVDAHTYRILYVSAQIEKLLGYPHRHWLEQTEPWLTLVHPDDRQAMATAFERTLAGERDQRCDHRSVDIHGRIRWFQTRVHLAGPDSGQPRFQGVSFDITQVKEAGERLREQMNFNHAIAASLGEGVVAVDLDDRITFLNEAAEEMLGCRGKAAVGQPLTELARVQAAEGRSVESPVSQAIRTGERIGRDEQFFTHEDEAGFPVHYTAAPILRDGQVAGAVLAFQDITERKRMEEAQRFLLEAGPALTASLSYQIAFNNLARLALPKLGDFCFIDVLGDHDKIQRIAWAHVDPVKQREFEGIKDLIPALGSSNHPVARVIQTGEPELVPNIDDSWLQATAFSEQHLQFIRRLGMRSMIIVPLRMGERRLGALSFAFSDSGRHHTQADLALAEELGRRASFALENGRLYEQAQHAIGVREQILAIVAHDLRSPLSAIFLSAERLKRKGVEEERRLGQGRAFATITRAAARMRRLIDDLLDFANIESGHLTIKPRLHDPASIIGEAVDTFETLAQEQELRLTAEAAVGLPLVNCDYDRILQVLSNLVGNAVKMVPTGGRITLGAEARGTDVVFSVVDTGPGIAEKDLRHLFERYWRSGEVTYKGTGLGLAIARGIVEAHGGRIWAESEPGHGAAFFFTIPVAPTSP